MRSSNDIKIRKRRKKSNPILKTLAVIGTTFLSLFLIVVITLCIVATALTVYVIKFMENSESVDIDLYNLDVMTTSFIYAEDPETGEQIEIHRMSQDANRILVSLDDIPQHVRDAFISTEDERFYEHEGVDFKRTFLAFANYFLHFWDENQGGSTITQQLVKNITGDDKQDPARKMREIFRAMNLEREYPKDVILEAYLNYIGFGGNTYGIQAAANKYFDKDVSELTVAEAACLAAIPKSTVQYNPLVHPENNEKRRNNVVLPTMLENGFISSEQYEEAINEQIIYAGQHLDEETGEIVEEDAVIQDWFVDMVIFDVARDFQKKYGIDTQEEAIAKISNGGYRIYATVDIDIQKEMEAKYLDNSTFAKETLSNPPQSAAIIMDYSGCIKGVVGGIGRKPNPMCYNRATMAKRSIGSTVKPISSYGYALYSDYINWSTVFFDEPIEVVKDWNTMEKMKWPKNYSNVWTGQRFFTYDALQRSLNTIPAQLVDQLTPKAVFDFMQNNMQITSLVAADADYSAMTVGGLTDGITLLELASAY
ncbi:MAG: transglycosylase domain-containing protein, partial [Oscillospiraceae bacterium]